MQCYVCNYTCVPQWMNTEASCLKCHTVLRKRDFGDYGPGVAVKQTRRQPDEVSTYKASGSAPLPGLLYQRPATSLVARKKDIRPASASAGFRSNAKVASQFRLDQSDYDDGRVRMQCYMCGYSCVPQWMNTEATCLKCHTVLRRRDFGNYGSGMAVKEMKREPEEVGAHKAYESAAWHPLVVLPRSASFTQLCRPVSASAGPRRRAGRGAPNDDHDNTSEPPSSGQEARVRMTCRTCGFNCVPQWMNAEATCLKCHEVLRRRDFGDYGNGRAVYA